MSASVPLSIGALLRVGEKAGGFPLGHLEKESTPAVVQISRGALRPSAGVGEEEGNSFPTALAR